MSTEWSPLSVNDWLKKIKENKTFEITFYAMLEKIIEIIVSVLTGIIVVRLLGIEDYGIISTIAGYATVINVINIAPVNYLYKEYNGKLKNHRDEAVSSFVLFEKFKAIVIVLIYLAVGICLSITKQNVGFIIIAISNGLALSIELFTNIERSILELNFLQRKITKTIFYSKIIKLVVTLLLFWHPLLIVIFIRDVGVALFEMIRLKRFTKSIAVRKRMPIKNVISNVVDALKGFCIANHFSGVLTNLIYGSDTMFLSMFCETAIVGIYGITLTCLNYFNPFFQVLQKNTMIELGACNQYEKDINIIKKYSKLSVVLSIVSFGGYTILGKLMFYIFTGDKATTITTYKYGLLIFAGVCIYNCVRPLTSYLCLRGNINRYVVFTILPSSLFAIVLYYISARYFGAMAVALSNIIAYGFWSILVLVYLFVNKKRIKTGYDLGEES